VGPVAVLLALAGCWTLALSDVVARELHVWMEVAVQFIP
jgi:hypothetical protein